MGQSRDAIVVLGAVSGAHGVRGWLRIRPYTVSTQSLLDYSTWWLKPRDAGWRTFARADGRVHGRDVLVALEGVETREAALALKGADVGVPRDALPAAAPGEVYWHDLIGMRVINRAGVELGEVRGVTEHGAHPLLRVALARGEGGGERLIPFVPAIVERVDVAGRCIDVDWDEHF
jgi:16S rRNA processing protein RimM